MDNGGVIPGLNEDWTFAGCKVFEWVSGAMTSMLVSNCFDKPGSVMPILVVTAVGTALGLAQLRRQFPDEERGVRNLIMVTCGIPPVGIPAPAKLQPRWSGARVTNVESNSLYAQLGLEALREKARDQEAEAGRL